MTVPWLVEATVGRLGAEYGDAPAFAKQNDEPLSYAELDRRSRQWADGLLNLGVGRGDRVGMLLHNAVEYVVGYLAVTRIGAIAVRFNWRLASRELAVVLANAECRLLLAHTAFADTLAGMDRPRTIAFGDQLPDWAEPPTVLETAPPGTHPTPTPTDDAMIMYTSGTTGVPKGAVWTHANTTAFAAMQAVAFGFDASTVALTTGPLYHCGAFEDLLLPALLVGGTAVCMSSGGLTVDAVLEVVLRHHVTDVLLYPFLLYELLERPALQLPSLRRIVTGGDPVAEYALTEVARRLPDVEIVQAYGLTEGGGMCTYLPGAEAHEHLGSVGIPLPLSEVRIVDETDETIPDGADGEILTRGPSVARGYWRDPEATAATFTDGWCRTGDIGRVIDRRLYITGRKKDMIRSGGENIYAAEVEQVVMQHKAVAEAVAIAVPDTRFTEVVCVVVVAISAVTAAEVIEHCRGQIADYKIPKYVEFVDSLPRSPAGKVSRTTLRETYAYLGDPVEDR